MTPRGCICVLARLNKEQHCSHAITAVIEPSGQEGQKSSALAASTKAQAAIHELFGGDFATAARARAELLPIDVEGVREVARFAVHHARIHVDLQSGQYGRRLSN